MASTSSRCAHTNIDFTEDEVKSLTDKVHQKNLNIGSIVAPFGLRLAVVRRSAHPQIAEVVANLERSCKLGKRLRDLRVRHYRVYASTLPRALPSG